jgi:hypothetical protein
MSAVRQRPGILTETSYDTDNRLPLQAASSCRSIVFGTTEVQHDAKEGSTGGGHDEYVKSESRLAGVKYLSWWQYTCCRSCVT